MIRIHEISMPPEHTLEEVRKEALCMLKLPEEKVRNFRIFRRSVDARKKPDVRIVYTADLKVSGNEKQILKRSGCRRAEIVNPMRYQPPKPAVPCPARPVIVGFGPAGIFAGLVLALAGAKPLILERGEAIDDRAQKTELFFRTGKLDPSSNIQFGEGGAGAFSDGKLNTGVNNPRIHWILEQFVEAGAREDILIDARPHVGTDYLQKAVRNLRRKIESLGGEIRFRTAVTGFREKNGSLTGVETQNGEMIPCRQVLLAVGHSARDTFRMLYDRGISMESKPFAAGVRIEHLQKQINRAQYGEENDFLPPAEYKLVRHLADRTVYTFCMCPGGYVMAAASEEGGVVTNGMSYADRDGENANAALLVTVNPRDFADSGPLAGMEWQRKMEQAAFEAGGRSYRAPAQLVGDFLDGKPSSGPGKVQPTYRPGVVWTDLHGVLPKELTCALEEALPQLDRNLAGFASCDAVLTGPVSRSSSPVRILRDESRQSSLRGLYPAGEGAGYAGGIMSAAIDGILSAEEMIRIWEEREK